MTHTKKTRENPEKQHFSEEEVLEGLEEAARRRELPGFTSTDLVLTLKNGKKFHPRSWLQYRRLKGVPIPEGLREAVGKHEPLEFLEDGTAKIVRRQQKEDTAPATKSSRTRGGPPLSDEQIKEGLEKAYLQRRTYSDVEISGGRIFNAGTWLSRAQQVGRAIPPELQEAVSKLGRPLQQVGSSMVIGKRREGRKGSGRRGDQGDQCTGPSAGPSTGAGGAENVNPAYGAYPDGAPGRADTAAAAWVRIAPAPPAPTAPTATAPPGPTATADAADRVGAASARLAPATPTHSSDSPQAPVVPGRDTTAGSAPTRLPGLRPTYDAAARTYR
ncbi:hypothetical protein [Micromonospora sp. SH-82]|uniref:hypothetical protein n=1 Tax=Micromonospora sp. SH-82 TaxID=3132938 RepID=UPI003EC0A95F